MHLSRFSDYTLRVLMYLGTRSAGEWIPVRQIADVFGISAHHLAKIAQWLTQQGYVESRRGRDGGVRLDVAAGKIDIGTVLRRTESTAALVECFDPTVDHCRISGVCRLRGYLGYAQEAFFEALDGVTLADLLQHPTPLIRRLESRD